MIHAFQIDTEKEEKKHKNALSHYLEKIHNATGYQNKEVAELLDMDKSYYNKIRLQQISPLTNSIILLKKFASLNNMNIIDFIATIEEIPAEIKTIDWMETLHQVMIDLGPILRRAFIHNRLSKMIHSNKDSTDALLKCFTYTSMLLDLVKYPKWFELCGELITKIHSNIHVEKNNDLSNLISRMRIKSKD